MTAIHTEAARRRTFAIISHPDAGKTTLTEKLLLFSGAIEEAGAVKARAGRQRDVTSDWMDIERQRGISITSTVLQFPHRDLVFNLLDTPGHRDFSEDTYRVLSAVDSAVIVLDAARGIEAQTPAVPCGPGEGDPAHHVRQQVGPARSVAVGDPRRHRVPAGHCRNACELAGGRGYRLRRGGRPPGRTVLAVPPHPPRRPDRCRNRRHPRPHRQPRPQPARTELPLLEAVEADHDQKKFLAGESTPVFFGSALWNFGIRLLLDAIADLAPAPAPRLDAGDEPRPLDAPLSGVVFKVQANLDPRHRDRIAFIRICSGRFERGAPLVDQRTGRSLTTKYAHNVFGRDRNTADGAYPGDIVGLVNATDVKPGDSLSVDGAVEFPPLPVFAPELFKRVRSRDTNRYKQFRKGVAQLHEEGVVQALRTDTGGEREPILAAVGEMQFEVAAHRLSQEFGADVVLEPTPFRLARLAHPDDVDTLETIRDMVVARRANGDLLALFASPYRLEAVLRDHPGLRLETILRI